MTETWINKDNALFYEKNTPILQQWAEAGGLTTWPDLKAIESYITNASNILEIGSGYGRAISYLLKHHSDKQITALERSSQLINVLNLQFEKKIAVVHADINEYKTTKPFSLILWLWSGFTDFSKAEQPTILQHVQSLLASKGALIIETFPHDITPANGSTTASQYYCLSANQYSLNGFIPTPDEMHDYAENAGLMLKELIEYTTTSGRTRKLYCLTKN